MKIQKTHGFKDNVTKEILTLFKNGADIVIIEYPKGVLIEKGGRCHVFIHNQHCPFFINKLWLDTNWILIKPLDKRVKNCLYSPHDYIQTVMAIKNSFPDIEFIEFQE